MSRPTDWQMAAACRDADSTIFFPNAGEKGLPAKSICYRCPVKEPCLDYALADPSLIGIWGGTSDVQRKHHHQLRKAIR